MADSQIMDTEKFAIRELRYEEYEDASRLMWLTYYKFESKGKTMEQIEAFRDSIEAVSLSMNSFDGRMMLLGAFDKSGNLAGTGGIKLKTYPDEMKDFVNENDHITLLFTDGEYHKKGIGRRLLQEMISTAEKRALLHSETVFITVNSSDFAVGFYEKNGFTKTGERTVTKDSVYTPMRYNANKE